MLTHFREDIPLWYSSVFRPCCNGSRHRLSRRWWDRLRPIFLQGERGCWTCALRYDCWEESSIDYGILCHYSCGEILGESTRLAWDWSRCRLRFRTRRCILFLCFYRLLRGRRAYLICLSSRDLFPAQCCTGCFLCPSIFLVCRLLRGMTRCSGRAGCTCSTGFFCKYLLSFWCCPDRCVRWIPGDCRVVLPLPALNRVRASIPASGPRVRW